MKRLSLMCSLALGCAAVISFSSPTVAIAAAEDVTVTGCLIKAVDDDDALLVTSLARIDAPPYTSDGRAAERRAPAYMRVVYWVDDDDEVEGHHGRLVEIRGEVEGDIDRGEVKIEREDGLVEVEFKGDGKRLKARLPTLTGAVGTSGGPDTDDREYDVIVRKLDVKEIRMIAPTCDGSMR